MPETEWKRWPGVTDKQIVAWVTEGNLNKWFRHHCDRCGCRPLHLWDVYPKMTHFGWVCYQCLIEIISDYGTDQIAEARREADELHKWRLQLMLMMVEADLPAGDREQALRNVETLLAERKLKE